MTLAFNSVGNGYFRTMTTSIVAGREFEAGERRRDVCVLNESAARLLFPGQSAIGRHVRSADNIGLELVRGGSGGACSPTRSPVASSACRRTRSSATCATRRRRRSTFR